MGMLMSEPPSRNKKILEEKCDPTKDGDIHEVRNPLAVKLQKTLKPLMRMRIAHHVTPHMARPG